jgi:DNA-binding NarL/FixJ family response regulator
LPRAPQAANVTDHQACREALLHPDPDESLTERETQVLRLLEAGMSIEEIAAVLHISSTAVERHTTSIYQKLMARRVSPPRAPERESSP